MLVLLPDEGALSTVERDLAGRLIDRAASALAPTDVVLRLPKWDVDTRVELSRALAALGLTTAFADAADFTGMTLDEPLQIGFVIHQGAGRAVAMIGGWGFGLPSSARASAVSSSRRRSRRRSATAST